MDSLQITSNYKGKKAKSKPQKTNRDAVTDVYIYCSVSTDKQIKKGNGLSSQENSCKNYLKQNKLACKGIYSEEAVSGNTPIYERPQMSALIEKIKASKGGIYILSDEQSRVARNISEYYILKQILAKYDSGVIYVKQSFEDTPEGNLLEAIAAATSEYERKSSIRRSTNRTHERMRQGYNHSSTFFGYKKGKITGVFEIQQEEAKLIKAIFEGYLSGRFSTYKEIALYLESQPAF